MHLEFDEVLPRVHPRIEQGAIVYVCGDGGKMEPAVKQSLVNIYQQAMGVDAAAALAMPGVRGVVLASGGFNRDPALRAQKLPGIPAEWCPASPGHTGEALALARGLGAVEGQGAQSPAFWAPVSLRKRADGSTAVFPHFVMDRAKPGMITVNQAGERFVNESTSYHLFALGMQAAQQAVPAYLIADAKALRQYGMGMVRPGGKGLDPFLADGYLNKRVMVYGIADEKFRRGWGAYGKAIKDIDNVRPPPRKPGEGPRQDFTPAVHCVVSSFEGLIYACDRNGNRIQVFTKEGKFVREYIVKPEVLGNGSAAGLALSRDPKQAWMFIADMTSATLWIMNRETGKIVGQIGRRGLQGGDFSAPHVMTIDAKGSGTTVAERNNPKNFEHGCVGVYGRVTSNQGPGDVWEPTGLRGVRLKSEATPTVPVPGNKPPVEAPAGGSLASVLLGLFGFAGLGRKRYAASMIRRSAR